MRAPNMAVLTSDIKKRYPGVVIYGIGNDAHKLRISDHNEDDTPGVRAAQSDADNIPEHRAIDVMYGNEFDRADANELVANLVSDPNATKRLKYIIHNGKIWSRKNGWKEADYNEEDKHETHIHISGDAQDDANTAHWPAVDRRAPDPTPKPPVTTVLEKGDKGTDVRHLQMFLRNTFPAYRNYVTYDRGRLLEVDGDFGGQTEAWVKEFQKRTGLRRDGVVGPKTFAKLRQYGYKY